jgi:hypothetical protein
MILQEPSRLGHLYLGRTGLVIVGKDTGLGWTFVTALALILISNSSAAKGIP